MNSDKPAAEQDQVAFHALIPFLAITFAVAWTILGLYILLPQRMAAIFGPLTGQHPLFYLAVYAPAIAACVLVVRAAGASGLRRFLGRALLWRCSLAWYAFLLIGIPVIFIAGAALKGSLFAEPFPFASAQAVLLALLLAAVKGPIEEFGWRGFALPLLQRRFAPIWSGLLLGAIWGLWHLPAFLLSGTEQSQWSFGAFFAGCLAISVIATALFNHSGGSILLTAFFHFSLMNPLFPDAQPYDTYLLLAAAAVIVWRSRTAMFGKAGAITRVIPAALLDGPHRLRPLHSPDQHKT
jgi:membrane protease YdiL (CAAX protease family)